MLEVKYNDLEIVDNDKGIYKNKETSKQYIIKTCSNETLLITELLAGLLLEQLVIRLINPLIDDGYFVKNTDKSLIFFTNFIRLKDNSYALIRPINSENISLSTSTTIDKIKEFDNKSLALTLSYLLGVYDTTEKNLLVFSDAFNQKHLARQNWTAFKDFCSSYSILSPRLESPSFTSSLFSSLFDHSIQKYLNKPEMLEYIIRDVIIIHEKILKIHENCNDFFIDCLKTSVDKIYCSSLKGVIKENQISIQNYFNYKEDTNNHINWKVYRDSHKFPISEGEIAKVIDKRLDGMIKLGSAYPNKNRLSEIKILRFNNSNSSTLPLNSNNNSGEIMPNNLLSKDNKHQKEVLARLKKRIVNENSNSVDEGFINDIIEIEKNFRRTDSIERKQTLLDEIERHKNSLSNIYQTDLNSVIDAMKLDINGLTRNGPKKNQEAEQSSEDIHKNDANREISVEQTSLASNNLDNAKKNHLSATTNEDNSNNSKHEIETNHNSSVEKLEKNQEAEQCSKDIHKNDADREISLEHTRLASNNLGNAKTDDSDTKTNEANLNNSEEEIKTNRSLNVDESEKDQETEQLSEDTHKDDAYIDTIPTPMQPAIDNPVDAKKTQLYTAINNYNPTNFEKKIQTIRSLTIDEREKDQAVEQLHEELYKIYTKLYNIEENKRLNIISKLLDDDTLWQVALQINDPFLSDYGVNYLLALKDFQSRYHLIITEEDYCNQPFNDFLNTSIGKCWNLYVSDLHKKIVKSQEIKIDDALDFFNKFSNSADKLVQDNINVYQQIKESSFNVENLNRRLNCELVGILPVDQPKMVAIFFKKIVTLDTNLSKLNSNSSEKTNFGNTVLFDVVLWKKLSLKKQLLSVGDISNLKKLKTFHDQKSKLGKLNNYSNDYQQSLDRFYESAVSIRLSEKSPNEQKQLIIIQAHEQFKHRDYYKRLLADVLMLVTVVGVVVGVVRCLSNNSFFFRDAKTQREIDVSKELISSTPAPAA